MMTTLVISYDDNGGKDEKDSFSSLFLKDGAYYCYSTYVLRISRYSEFLLLVLINTGIFLHGLKLCGKSRTEQLILVSKKKIRGNHAFFRDN